MEDDRIINIILINVSNNITKANESNIKILLAIINFIGSLVNIIIIIIIKINGVNIVRVSDTIIINIRDIIIFIRC
jgi:hypothetical protein